MVSTSPSPSYRCTTSREALSAEMRAEVRCEVSASGSSSRSRAIAWLPAPQGETPPGHLWGWQLEPVEGGTLVTHLYDYSQLYDEKRLPKAQAMTAEKLLASIDRLAALVEEGPDS